MPRRLSGKQSPDPVSVTILGDSNTVEKVEKNHRNAKTKGRERMLSGGVLSQQRVDDSSYQKFPKILGVRTKVAKR